MNSFFTQFKTDLSDDKFKLFLVTGLFTSLFLASIVTTFYMEEIMKLLGFEDFPTLVTPSARAAFFDFLGDQVFFGLLIMTLGSMGIFASEINSGAISYSLTRPISRVTYSLSKTLSRSLTLTVPLLIGSLIGWGYINLAFETFPLEILLATLLPLLLLFFYMGFLTSLFSTRFPTTNTGFLTIALLIFQLTISVLEPLTLLSPFALADIWVDTLQSTTLVISSDFLLRIVLLLGWMVLPLLLTLYSLDKRDL